MIEKSLIKNWVVVDFGAVEPIKNGANALAIGITDVYPDITKGEEVVVLSPDRGAIAVGRAMMMGKEMLEKKGVGVKTRWYGREEKHIPLPERSELDPT